MKRRIGKNIAGLCVAGMVLGAPGAAVAAEGVGGDGTTPGGQEAVELQAMKWVSSENMVVCLYGPPSMFERGESDIVEPEVGVVEPEAEEIGSEVVFEEPVQVLYGPPSVFMQKPNPMVVRPVNKTVKAKKLAVKKRTLSNVVKVSKAKGKVSYARVAKGSSSRLSVNKKTGAVTVKKGTKVGRYAVKVRVKAAGTDVYTSAAKTVVVRVCVK